MPSVTYYLNAPDLASATGVYMDSDLTICAPDGFYQQDSIVRQMLDCVLLPQQSCPECAQPCGDVLNVEGSGEGVYIMNIDVGSGIGAITIKTNPLTVPKGYSALFNSTIYNKFSSPVYGYLAAPSTEVTYLGDLYFDCGLVAGSPYDLQVYKYNGTDFVIAPSERETFNITNPQLQLTGSNPGNSVMVIPKTSATPSVVQMTIISGCPTSAFEIEIGCVGALQSYPSSGRFSTSTEACGNAVSQTYYSAPVNGDGTTLGLYDWVFSDANGQNILPNGYYYAPVPVPGSNDYYRVENGVIVEFGACPTLLELPFEVAKDITSPCGLNVTGMRLQVDYGFIPVLDVYYPDAGSIPVVAGPYTAKLSFIWANITPACCDMELVLEYAGVEIATFPLPTPPVNGDYYEVTSPFTISTTQILRAFIRCV